MNKKLNFSSRKAAVRKVLEHNIAPALVAKSVGISTKTMLRYLEEFYPVTDDRPYELVNAATTSFGEFPCGVKADTLVDVILYQDNELCTGMAMSFIWRGINRIKAYRVTKTKEDVIEMQRDMVLKDLKRNLDVDRLLGSGYCYLKDFNLQTVTGKHPIAVHIISKSFIERRELNVPDLDLNDVLLVKPSLTMTSWVMAENYKFKNIDHCKVVDLLHRDGRISCRVPAVTIEGFKEKQESKGYSHYDITAIRDCKRLFIDGQQGGDFTFVNEEGTPITLISSQGSTLIDVMYHTGDISQRRELKSLDWGQYYNRPSRIVAWRLHKADKLTTDNGEEPTTYFGYKDPTYSEHKPVEDAVEGFDNISIISDCVVAYRTKDVTHPVLVLKEKRPIEYMKICSLMGLGDEEGIKDVLRGIFDK